MKKRAIIIGAGPAGLTAAYCLLKQAPGIQPVILEETNEIGGISRTVSHDGNRMDLGGHRFFSKSREVMEFWKEHMPVQGFPALDDKLLHSSKKYVPGGPDPETEDRVLLLRNRFSRILYLRKFFDYPISLKPRTFLNMGIRRTVCAAFGCLCSMCFKRNLSERLHDQPFRRPPLSYVLRKIHGKSLGTQPGCNFSVLGSTAHPWCLDQGTGLQCIAEKVHRKRKGRNVAD